MSIPTFRETDPEDVAWGRQTAEALWRRGDRTDAIMWLRRAAQAAGDAADDHRALELASTAAELSDWVARHPPPRAPDSVVILSGSRALWRSDAPAAALEAPRVVIPSDPWDPDSERAASFRLVRDNVLAKEPRIIAVASAAPGEGKTTCAINLAFAMCERPHARVLLVDGNFFVPSLGDLFHIDAATPVVPGTDFPWVAPYRVAQVSRGLHVAAIVRRRGTRGHVFDRRSWNRTVDHLAGGAYDHVIIDGPALDGASTATEVAGAADGTLFTVRSGGTRATALRRAANLIPRDRVLGVVLMG